MALIPALVVFAPGTKIKSAEANSNFDAIKTAFNTSAVLTDVARTINVAHTFNNDILFTDASFDIGKTGATRPRDGFFSRNVTAGTAFLGALTGNVTGNVTGNLTGTVLTASQPNITSLGALTGLTITGTLSVGGGTNPILLNRLSDSTTYGAISFSNSLASASMMGIYGRTNGTEALHFSVPATVGFDFIVGNLTKVTIDSTGLITAPSFTGNLTGTILTASQPNITGLGTIAGLVVSNTGVNDLAIIGSPTGITQIKFGTGSANSSVSSEYSGGYLSLAYNAAHTAKNVDNWHQELAGLGSTLISVAPSSIDFYRAVAGKADGTQAAFWGSAIGSVNASGLVGNLTGTILTPAQANITSLGTLTGLVVSAAAGAVVVTGDVKVQGTLSGFVIGRRDTSASAWTWYSAAGVLQLFDVVAGADRLTLTTGAGGLLTLTSNLSVSGTTTGTFSGNITGNITGNLTGTVLTAAQGNITSLGTLTSLTVSGALSAGATTVTSLIGLVATTLGAPSANTATLATIGGAGSPVATQAQAKWLPITGSDALVYYVPAWR